MCNPLSDFDRWWIEEGQFIPPCDRLAGQTSLVAEQLMAFAQKIAKACKPEIDAAYDEGWNDGGGCPMR